MYSHNGVYLHSNAHDLLKLKIAIPLFRDDRTRVVNYPLQVFIIDWLLRVISGNFQYSWQRSNIDFAYNLWGERPLGAHNQNKQI